MRGHGKFLVLKNDDLNHYLSEDQDIALHDIIQAIRSGRRSAGKSTEHEYFIINRDEPYADEIKEIMKKHGHYEE